jgi:hypothetical protein
MSAINVSQDRVCGSHGARLDLSFAPFSVGASAMILWPQSTSKAISVEAVTRGPSGRWRESVVGCSYRAADLMR